jgi:hypothetical protein
MTTKPEDSTAEQSPDYEGDLHLGEGTPDPQGPINTGHVTDPSFAECEDVPGSDAV